jgi:hypothetical protein
MCEVSKVSMAVSKDMDNEKGVSLLDACTTSFYPVATGMLHCQRYAVSSLTLRTDVSTQISYEQDHLFR